MKNNQTVSREYMSIDLLYIIKSIWHRAWIVMLAAIIAATAGFCVATYLISPSYSSSILLYVNNNSVDLGSTTFSISSADLTASQALVKTYTELLKNRTTLKRVAEKSGLDYSYRQIDGMISAGSSNETEIMKVTVVCNDPYHAAKLANTIAEVLPERVSEIIDGASMEVVDSAIPNLSKIAPSVTRYTARYMIVAAVAAAALIALFATLDDTIRDEEYILQSCKYPILARIPDLAGQAQNSYQYYKHKSSSKAVD